MSIKICTRLIPTILKQTSNKQIIIFHNYKVLSRNNSPVSLHLNTVLDNLRFASTSTTQNATKSEQNTTRTVQVYYGTLTPQLRAIKFFSFLTSFAGIAAQPFMYKEIASLGSMPLIIVACSFVGLFTVVTPILLHLMAKKYITTLTYKPETGTYVASTLSFFNRQKQLEFTPSDVKVPDVLGMFTSLVVKGKPLFMDPRLFQDPSHYGKIMGYDKPLDLKLYETSLNEEKKKKS